MKRKREGYGYVISRHWSTAANAACYGLFHSNRKRAWDEFLKDSTQSKAYWQKHGLRSYRVKVTAEVVG